MALANKPVVGKLVQPAVPSLQEVGMATETVTPIVPAEPAGNIASDALSFFKQLPQDALATLAKGLKIDVGVMTGIVTPIEPIVKSILENISARRNNMSQKNRDWDDAMDLQIKQDLWQLGRGLLEKASLLDPLPADWASKARGEG